MVRWKLSGILLADMKDMVFVGYTGSPGEMTAFAA
jgi:hypothetical protein